MGVYNSHAPQILGQEWVGILDEDMTFTPSVNVLEVGHQFTATASRTLQDARFYINEWPPGRALGQVFLATIYSAGREAETGPIRSVVIPCNNALLSGGANGTVSPAAVNLADPSDNQNIQFPRAGSGGVGASIQMHFATNQYNTLLNGKRIVGVNFLYTLAANSGVTGTAPPEVDWGNLSIQQGIAVQAVGLSLAQAAGSLLGLPALFRVGMGEVDHFWGGGAPTGSSERMPWRYQGLQNFEISGSPRLSVTYGHPLAATWDGYMSYAALEVLFCDENRLLYGGKSFGESGIVAGHTKYTMGTNIITMRDLTYTASPVLAAGDYTLVISSANLGDIAGTVGLFQRPINLSQYPLLNGLRQLYAMPQHTGIQVNVTQTEGEVFTKEEITVLPQLSLHVSGGPVTEVHVYGRQAAAQVYGTITATQEVLDSAAGAAYSYPWVRFYARRFGDTTVPLKLDSPTITGAGMSVQITPTEWDALDNIIDQWKEVTLRFPTTGPTMGTGTTPQWRWSATGELAGNRWEVLGVTAPALSGITGNLLNLVPSPQQLSTATYGQPTAGSTVNMGWMPQYAPPVSATADDTTSDAVLMFARDMPTITGFAASLTEQEVTGIGLDCGVDPCCIPSAIDYVHLTWAPNQGVVLWDSFSRTSASGWGTADSGQTWSSSGGSATDYIVNNGTGQQILTGSRMSFTNLNNWSDVDATVLTRVDQLATGASIVSGLLIRWVDTSNFYTGDLIFNTDGSLSTRIRRTIAGSPSTIATYSIGNFTHDTSAYYYIHFQAVGTTLRMNVWPSTENEPDVWQIVVIDSTFTTGGIGLRTVLTGGNTNVGAKSYWDNLYATPYFYIGSKYEIQRMDTVETDWKTIMLSTALTGATFNDFEARVGILSSYRLRMIDPYDFEGPWSSTVTATVPGPGVTIGCEGGHLLIFTSNEQQDGSINLAYSSVWEDRVQEEFTFAESQFVTLQAMYNRDFFTAFRPTERGGEQFSRTVLVQAAAISAETLGDFTSLRDMAWANVSYICVRDEDGNRWFATVLVPNGRVLRDRRLYLAPVEIIEVTDTPSQVNP